jgi:hypothetical protein
MAVRVVEEEPGWVYDDRGLYIPSKIYDLGKYVPHAFDNPARSNVRGSGIVRHTSGLGTVLQHDTETGVAMWPSYASGLDDLLARSLVRGYMANSGQTPVVISLLATIVTKIQSMCSTWASTVRGKKSPVAKTLDLMSRAQDSQFGSAEFVKLYMGALLTENRGAIGAQVPIETIDVDSWEQYGMELEPVLGQPAGKEDKFILRMTTEAFRENQGLWMVDGLSCYPTGSSEYPYWIGKYSKQLKKTVFVLIHRDFGFQIRAESGGKINDYPGFGQSPTWRFSPYCVKFMAIDRQDWEHLINQPARGVIWVSGLDYATQFQDSVEAYQESRDEQKMYFYPGVLFGGSRGENSKITLIPWSEPPAGYTAEGWRTEWVDALAAAFHLNVTHLEVRMGEGAMTQTDVASSIEAETAVAAMKQQIEMIWNYMAPPRVLVDVIWQTDRLKRYQTETFRELSLGISRVQGDTKVPPVADGGPVTVQPEQTFTREEIRGLFEAYIGIEIPLLEEDDTIEKDKKSPEDVEDFYVPAFGNESLASLSQRFSARDIYQSGNIVSFANSPGKRAFILSWSGNNDWAWIRTTDGYDMLVDGSRLKLLFAVGNRAKLKDGTPCTLLYIDSQVAHVRYDWQEEGAAASQIPAAELRIAEFVPEGEPLEPVTEVSLNPTDAEDDAKDTWDNTVQDEDKEDLL